MDFTACSLPPRMEGAQPPGGDMALAEGGNAALDNRSEMPRQASLLSAMNREGRCLARRCPCVRSGSCSAYGPGGGQSGRLPRAKDPWLEHTEYEPAPGPLHRPKRRGSPERRFEEPGQARGVGPRGQGSGGPGRRSSPSPPVLVGRLRRTGRPALRLGGKKRCGSRRSRDRSGRGARGGGAEGRRVGGRPDLTGRGRRGGVKASG